MKTNYKFSMRVTSQSFGKAICGCMLLVVTTGAPAQNLFVAGGYDGTIYEYTPGGVQSTFATGLSGGGLAFNSAGNLFETDTGSGSIYEYTPGGARSTFASGLNYPGGLAFNSAGDLFVADNGTGSIYEFTPGGVQSTFATGLSNPG